MSAKTKAHHTHREIHFQGSLALRDLVIGISDGLTVPFALAAGLSAAIPDTRLIVIAGLAELAAGSISMGLGGFLAGRTEEEHYKGELKREQMEVERVPETEKEEIREIFATYGLTKETIEVLVEDLAKDKTQWVNFMMKFELGMDEPRKGQALASALRIGLAYGLGGLIPLLPYFWTQTPHQGLIVSSLFTGIALFIFGSIKAKLTGQKKFVSALKVTLVGATAAASAFALAKLLGS